MAEALASFAQIEDLPLLRQLAKDRNSGVRARVAEALASFAQIEDLPLLRQLAKDQNSDVRMAVMKVLASLTETLASFLGPEVFPMLLELVKDSKVRTLAINALASFPHPQGSAAAARTSACIR